MTVECSKDILEDTIAAGIHPDTDQMPTRVVRISEIIREPWTGDKGGRNPLVVTEGGNGARSQMTLDQTMRSDSGSVTISSGSASGSSALLSANTESAAVRSSKSIVTSLSP